MPAPLRAGTPAFAPYNPPMHKLMLTAAALGFCASLTACGLKGDLYLPPPKEQATPATPATPAEPAIAPAPASQPEDPEREGQQPPTG